MPLTSIGISSSFTWQLSRTNTGFANATQGSDSLAFSANTLSVATWNELFAATYTILTTGTQVVDLRAFTDLVSTVVTTADKVLAFQITVTGTATDALNVKPHTASNALVWPFGTTADSINVYGGGSVAYSMGVTSVGQTIDATHRNWLLTNNGAGTLTVKVVALVSDV